MNLFKNAFEAAAQSEEKWIRIIDESTAKNFILSIQNTAISAPMKQGEQIISSKEESGHGYGLRNVMECVDRHGGSYEYTYNSPIFASVLTLPI